MQLLLSCYNRQIYYYKTETAHYSKTLEMTENKISGECEKNGDFAFAIFITI